MWWDPTSSDPASCIFPLTPSRGCPTVAPRRRAAGTDDAGQTGYLLGNYPVPGQSPSSPAVVLSNMPGARGVTNVYLTQSGQRELKDTRIASHQPNGTLPNHPHGQ